MLTAFRNGLLLMLCGMATAAPVAAAQDDEVFVDPDSPSGKEYALPIDTARQAGAANTRQQQPSRGAGDAPLFGAGVGADGNGAGTSAPTRARDGSRARQDELTDAQTTRSAQAQAQAGTVAKRAATAVGPGGTGSLAAIAGVGLGVLLVGALAGLLLRRRRV